MAQGRSARRQLGSRCTKLAEHGAVLGRAGASASPPEGGTGGPARLRSGRGQAATGRAGPERKGLPLVCSLSRSSPSGPLCRRVSGEDLLDADRALALGLHHVLRQVSVGQSPRYALAHEANGKLQVTETTQTGLGPQWNQPECRNRQQESLRKNGRSLKGNKKRIELN